MSDKKAKVKGKNAVKRNGFSMKIFDPNSTKRKIIHETLVKSSTRLSAMKQAEKSSKKKTTKK